MGKINSIKVTSLEYFSVEIKGSESKENKFQVV
jgi:hypothetical protein